MAKRIEIRFKEGDARALVRKNKLNNLGFNIKEVSLIDVYTIDVNLSNKELEKVAEMLYNPVTQEVSIDKPFIQANLILQLKLVICRE